MTVRVGTAEVAVVPSFKGFSTSAKRNTEEALKPTEQAAGQSGERAGQKYGKGFSEGDKHGPGIKKQTEEGGSGSSEEGKKTGGRFRGGFLESMKGMGEAIAAYWVADKAIDFLKDTITEGNNAIVTQRSLEARLKSTGGAAGFTAKDLEELAGAMGKAVGTDDDYQIGLENLLLTFTNIKGVIFQEALPAVNDIAAAMHESGQSAAIQLGKALNDPIAGMTALRRVGIQLDTQQQEQIKTWVAQGQTAKAQSLILTEVEKEMGGSAEAAATPQQKLNASLAQMKETIGLSLVPIVQGFASALSTSVVPQVTTFFAVMFSGKSDVDGANQSLVNIALMMRDTFISVFKAARDITKDFIAGFTGHSDQISGFGSIVAGAGSAVHSLMVAIGDHPKEVRDMAVAVLALVAAFKTVNTIQSIIGGISPAIKLIKALTVGYYGLVTATEAETVAATEADAAMSPVLLIVIAVIAVLALLALAAYEIYAHWKGFSGFFIGLYQSFWDGFVGPIWRVLLWLYHNVFDPIWHGMVAVGNAFVDQYRLVAAAFTYVIHGIENAVSAVASFFVGAWHGAVAVFHFFVNGVKTEIDIFKGVFGVIAGVVRTVIGVVQGVIASFVRFFHPVFFAIGVTVAIVSKIFEVAWGLVRVAFKLLEDAIRGWVIGAEASFAFIKALVVAAWHWIYTTFIQPAMAGFHALGVIFVALYNAFILPAWNWIKAKFAEGWAGVKAIFTLFMIGVRDVGNFFVFLYHAYILPAWNWIKAKFAEGWAAIKIIWAAFKAEVQSVGGFFAGLYRKYIAPIWDSIKAKFAEGWKGMKVIFDALAKIVTKTIPDAFHTGVGAIAKAWSAVQDAAKVPVKFIVDTVINNGIIKGFNWIADKVHVKKIDELKIPGFATGGHTGRGGKHEPAGIVHKDEFVVPKEEVQRWGVGTLNSMFLAGKRPAQYPGDGSEGVAVAGLRGYADGGLVGWLSKGWSALTDPVGAVKKFMQGLLKDFPAAGQWGDILKGTANSAIDGFGKWIGEKFTGGYSGPVTPTIKAAQDFIKSQNHKPYVWAGAGPGGADCSGFVSEVYNILSGKSTPWGHTFSTSNEAPFFPNSGHGAFTAGWSNAGERGGGDVGHTAGNLAGLAFESGGAGGDMHYGAGSTSVDSFAHVGHMKGFAAGGIAGPGSFVVGEEGPEVITSRVPVSVTPNSSSAKTLHIHLNWDGREITDRVVRIVGDELEELANVGNAGG